MTPRQWLLGGALALATGLVLFDRSGPAGDPAAAAVDTAPRPAARPSHTAAVLPPSAVLTLLPRAALYDSVAGADRYAVFGSRDWTPPPPSPPAAAPAPPQAPALPFVYIGKALRAGQWEVYLARGEDTLIVRDQSAIDSQYRVTAIAPPMLSLLYLPLNQTQQINIGVPD